MMKITLISPNAKVQTVGLRILSACLKKEDHEVKVLFLRNPPGKRYASSVMEELSELAKDAGLVGIMVLTDYYLNAIQVTEHLKKSGSPLIVWGGIHPTVRPEECLQHADAVCVGEGEQALPELVRRLERGEDFRSVPSMWVKDQGKMFRNTCYPLITDLDSLPFPDYDFEDHYVLTDQGIQVMDLHLAEKYLEKKYQTLATRGCSFGCTYCCNNTLNQLDPNHQKVRMRSPKNLIEELAEAKNKLPFIQGVKLNDDAFFFYPEDKIREFCEGYKLHVRLPLMITGISPASFKREKLALLVDAGLNRVRVGIQTGSERIKTLYKRNYSHEKVMTTVNTLHEFQDKLEYIQYDIILDNPWETDDDLIETLMMLVRFPVPYYTLLPHLIFYPETELYHLARKDGFIRDDFEDIYAKPFYNVKKTYLNNLFFLLRMYAWNGRRLSPKVMAFLTHRVWRRLGLSYLLYYVLLFERSTLGSRQLLRKGWEDILKGDWSRIRRWVGRTCFAR